MKSTITFEKKEPLLVTQQGTKPLPLYQVIRPFTSSFMSQRNVVKQKENLIYCLQFHFKPEVFRFFYT